MLSRVADALFWTGRYLERAENTARLLNVSLNLELDLQGVSPRESEGLVAAVAEILQCETDPAADLGELCSRLTFQRELPGSVASCIGRGRNNARHVRGHLTAAIWRELNKLFWQLRDPQVALQANDSPHEVYQSLINAGQLIQGLCDATLSHDEGWHFIQLGKHLERAERTLRVLDVRTRTLLSAPTADLSLSSLQWAGVLRTCLAYEAFQRRYVGRVEPDRVVKYLLLEAEFPRSVRFCFEQCAAALAAIKGAADLPRENRADRIIGRLVSELEYAEPEQLAPHELPNLLANLLERTNRAGLALQRQYALP